MSEYIRSVYSIADGTGNIYFNRETKQPYRVVLHKDWYEKIYKVLTKDPEHLEKFFNAGLVRMGNVDKLFNNWTTIELEPIYSFSFMEHKLKRQIRDMLVMVCELNLLLSKIGLVTSNYHQGDINLKGCVPKLTDLGSFSVLKNESIRTMFLRLFYILGKFVLKIPYSRTHEYCNESWFNKNHPMIFQVFADESSKNRLEKKYKKLLTRTSTYLKELTFEEKAGWCPYQESFRKIVKEGFSNKKEVSVFTALDKGKNEDKTLFEIGCNKGLYLITGAKMGYNAMGCDIDEKSLAEGYEFCKTQDDIKEKVHYLYTDFNSLFTCIEECPSLHYIPYPNKYKSDVVLCVAFMHHWIKKRPLAELIGKVSELALHRVIFENTEKDRGNYIQNVFRDYGLFFEVGLESNVAGREIYVFKRKERKEKLL